ncbi:MAG TPA: copper resistance system multicopper oxidase, partial [Phenylobacterium sp.]|nr:copper resistance system multicopper oxidase [Phenylobacterium sp.]
MSRNLHRRQLLSRASLLGGGLAASTLLPAWAQTAMPGLARQQTLTGPDIALTIDHASWRVDGRSGHAVAINGTVPGPLIRLKEGQNVRLSVTNRLPEETSIHWHGLLVPFQMDGVPGVSFPGIKPGATFTYEFPILQNGTYWYHSHSGLQEQEGHYGPIVIDPKGSDPVRSDREHVVVLSDFSFMHPHRIMSRLKQEAGFFNYQKQTVAGLLAGRDQTLQERIEWSKMRMDPTDVSDVTGSVYKFLINGHGPNDNWTGLFKPGERVRLRFINAAAMTVFNVRIPGLKMTVVQADGQNVRPVAVDEFQISIAETYDVIVEPKEDKAFTLVAEAADRSGMGRATLAPREGMTAVVPPLRDRPLANMKDMGMDMSAMDHGAGAGPAAGGVDHAAMGHTVAPAAPGAASSMPGM